MSRSFQFLIVAFFCFMLTLLLNASTSLAVPLIVNHTSPELKYLQTAEFKVSISAPAKGVRFFYRQPDVSMYQMRFMEDKGSGIYTHELATKFLTNVHLIYNFEVITAYGIYAYPAKAPDEPVCLNVKEPYTLFSR